eukprot:TRINITY_DN9624_c0_g1_i1.p1 TRINITY_DN9624_c0_g1~~TRINITY_DN9624_c0_g1_i1.p1  ORF type:complete len:361 (-),score=96.74 TRINITY_DN9624_c0_g1_i1:7-1089(-)
MSIFDRLCSSDPAHVEAINHSRRLERQLAQDGKRLRKEIKILLLGTGDSGKSTVAKQMKIIYLTSFTEEERHKWRSIIHGNIALYVKTLADQMAKFNLEFEDQGLENAIQPFYALSDVLNNCTLSPELGNIAVRFWNDKSIQATWERNNEYQLSDSAPYFLTEADVFTKPDYSPTDEDVLRARVKTTGINEVEFPIEAEVYKMVDVGGQRSERKKWIHCFQDVTSILFVVALSEYNLMLEEAENTNRMHESLKLFEDIINNVWFMGTPIILFLNKKDLFEQKISKVPLTVCFPEYRGAESAEPAMHYIREQYLARDRKQASRSIYSHFTCATNTDNIKTIFRAVQEIVIKGSLGQLFIMD